MLCEDVNTIGRETVLRLLKSRQLELHNLGVRSLALFGSMARNEAHPDSDVDLLVEFDPPVTFDRYMCAKFFFRGFAAMPGRSCFSGNAQRLGPSLR
jgi:hypothetical protein